MKTNFKEYLKKKKAQNVIDKFARQYKGKSVILYGAGLFAGDLIRNYDLSKLNIIGVSDFSFQDDSEGNYYEYKKIAPEKLLKIDFDLLLITAYDDTYIKKFLKKDLLKGEKGNFKVRTLISLSLFEYINAIVKSEI